MPRGFGKGAHGFGRGMGNPYPFWRQYPWLPRWWWGGYGFNTPVYGMPLPYYYSNWHGRWY
ncbi:MAG: hypothetical protein ACXQTO_05850 [Candidatus Syntropharchaeales archaeon]